jgi:hypothetical protein
MLSFSLLAISLFVSVALGKTYNDTVDTFSFSIQYASSPHPQRTTQEVEEGRVEEFARSIQKDHQVDSQKEEKRIGAYGRTIGSRPHLPVRRRRPQLEGEALSLSINLNLTTRY